MRGPQAGSGLAGARAKIAKAERAVDVNQEQLLEIVRPHLKQNRHLRGKRVSPPYESRVRPNTDSGRDGPVVTGPLPACFSARRHLSKVDSTLHQLSREWGAEGKAEREQCFGPILSELKAWLPVRELNEQRVVVPGVGLGRLAAPLKHCRRTHCIPSCLCTVPV